MRREELFEILGQIDDRFIIPARRERKVIHWNHYVGVAAALCVIVGGVWFLLHMEGSGIGLRPGMPTDPTVVTTAPTDPTDESTQPTTETTAPTETEPTESTDPSTEPPPSTFDIDTWKQYSHQPETYRSHFASHASTPPGHLSGSRHCVRPWPYRHPCISLHPSHSGKCGRDALR